MERIPVFAPWPGPDTRAHVNEAFDAGWPGTGAAGKEFEERIAGFPGLSDRHVVATHGGVGLHIAPLVAAVGPAREVIAPSCNYVADHQSVRMAGAEAVMCGIHYDNPGLDADQAEEPVTDRTKAIIPLHSNMKDEYVGQIIDAVSCFSRT